MRDFVERHHIFIGFFLIIVILTGTTLLWLKDLENRKSFKLSDNHSQIEELKVENEKLKIELDKLKNTEIVGQDNKQNQEIKSDKTNINVASQKELEDLPAIGPVYAQRIIEYRENVSVFNSIDDIKQIKGIGEKVFNTIKDLIDVR